MASFLQSLIDPRKNWLAKQHMKTLSSRLRRYGLRYDDLYDPYYETDIKEALNRLPREIVDARNQRLKRAMDLSMKHEYLPEDLQVLWVFACLRWTFIGNANTIQELPARNADPKKGYMKFVLFLRASRVKKERAEREALGALPLYQRTIP
ncbi:hypothetical protein NC651_038168 [Populus alba x Populus x berolinensis]|nr:hypothetical protein NC651_038168 [Populus alba x Populus x berolinensis]